MDSEHEVLPRRFYFLSGKSNHSNQSSSFYLESLHILCYSLSLFFTIFRFTPFSLYLKISSAVACQQNSLTEQARIPPTAPAQCHSAA
jgi:hypothetical protein